MILVTGATGHLGRLVVSHLLARVPAAQVVAGVRNRSKAGPLDALGVQVRELDYDRPATAEAAMKGIEKVLLISSSEFGNRVGQHQVVIDAAKRAGVKLLAYTGILHAETSKLALAADHQATEKALRASGVPFVLLRNGWYHENYTGNLATTLQHGVMLGAAGNGRVAPAARVDFAEAAVAVLTTPGHEGRAYELAGDRAYTLHELAAEVSRVSGKPVTYQNLPFSEYAATLKSFGLPPAFAELLADSDVGIERGDLDDSSGTLRTLIGRPTTPFADAVAAALRG
ncbi:MAG: SDR family oxidoreductase [Myxococcaceae bacterium]|jgi:NAD(P)H dehydrogenase (quinone)|nr:SDR family oxidoreductase [Myxococcaceae bacterium]